MEDKKEKEGVSLALIVPLVWFLRAASRGISYWLSPESTAMNDVEFDYLKGSPLDRNFLVALEFIGVAILVWRRINWWEFVKQNKWIIILYLYMGMSIFWSAFPEVSFKRWVRSIGDLIMMMVVITEFDYSAAAARMFRIWSYLLVPLSVLFIKYWRNLGVSYDSTGVMEMWIGVTTHKNSLGQLVCISSFFLVWVWTSRMYKRRLADIPVLLMALWLLSGSKSATSRTSLGVFVTGVFVLVLLRLLKTNIRVIRTAAVVLVTGFILGNIFTQHFAQADLIPFIAAKTGGDPTLTGRTYLWDELIKIGASHPVLGVGYGGFWIGDVGNHLWETFNWHPGQAHNGYIDIYIDLGIIGLVLLSVLIVSTFRSIMRNLAFDSDWGRFRLSLLLMIIIYNVTESSFFKPTSMLWITFLLIALRVPEPFPEEGRVKAMAVSRRRTEPDEQEEADEVAAI